MQRILLPLALLFCCATAFAQKTSAPDKSMLIPMLTDAEMQALPTPGQGAMIFNTTAQAFYFHDNTGWRPLLSAERSDKTGAIEWHEQRVGAPAEGAAKVSSGSTGFWDLTGNSGTSDTNFLGTTDTEELRMRVNNTWAGHLSWTTGGPVAYGLLSGSLNTGIANTFIGATSGLQSLNADYVTYIGAGAGENNQNGDMNVFVGQLAGGNGATGGSNTFVGRRAGRDNTVNDNVMVGTDAGLLNSTGANNTFLGSFTGNVTSTGGQNTFLGAKAGQTNTTGQENTTLGFDADLSGGALVNATAIGSRSRAGSSNSLVLGSINGVNGATADANVGIGTSTPQRALHVTRGTSGGTSNTNAVVVVEDNTNAYINLMTPDANESGLLFGTPTSNAEGGIVYNQGSTPNGLGFRTNGNVTRAVIDDAGLMGIGILTPATHMDINGGLALRRTGSVNVPTGTSTLTVGDNSYLRLNSTGASTVNLSNGLAIGQILMVEGSGGTVTINDNALVSNCNLVANRALASNDMLTLLWNGTDWVELSFANN